MVFQLFRSLPAYVLVIQLLRSLPAYILVFQLLRSLPAYVLVFQLLRSLPAYVLVFQLLRSPPVYVLVFWRFFIRISEIFLLLFLCLLDLSLMVSYYYDWTIQGKTNYVDWAVQIYR